jgi:hypothetical protein
MALLDEYRSFSEERYRGEIELLPFPEDSIDYPTVG